MNIKPKANVAELIDKTNHCWKADLIQQLFSPNEVKVITAIPISIVEKADKQVWFHTRNRQFTFRNSYHFQHSISLTSRSEPFSCRVPNSCWQSIWKLEVWNRTTLFVWKACKKILPTLFVWRACMEQNYTLYSKSLPLKFLTSSSSLSIVGGIAQVSYFYLG